MLGDIQNNKMKLNDFGEIVKTEWIRSFTIRREVVCDSYVIMPNHIHAIIFIDQFVGANGGLPVNEEAKGDKQERANCHSPLHMKPRSLSSFVSGFKSSVSRKSGFSIWQRNYYDHIIRNGKELCEFRKYIKNNPYHWVADEYNPLNDNLKNHISGKIRYFLYFLIRLSMSSVRFSSRILAVCSRNIDNTACSSGENFPRTKEVTSP
jgi:putative transposase